MVVVPSKMPGDTAGWSTLGSAAGALDRLVRGEPAGPAETRLRRLLAYATERFGKAVLDVDSAESCELELDRLAESPHLLEVRLLLLSELLGVAREAPEALEAMREPTALRNLLERFVGPEVASEQVGQCTSLLGLQARAVGALGPGLDTPSTQQAFEDRIWRQSFALLESVRSDAAFPSELRRTHLAVWRGEVCLLALAALAERDAESQRGVPSWLPATLVDGLCRGLRASLRLLATVVPSHVPDDVVPEHERFTPDGIDAAYREARNRLDALFRDARHSGEAVYAPYGPPLLDG